MLEAEIELLRADIVELIAERDEWKARCEFSFEQRDKLNAQLKTLQYEVDAIPAIKAERDQFEIAMRGWMAANAPGGWIDDLRKERDALKDAARLALDALEATYQLDSKTLPPSVSFSDVYNKQLSARTALRKVVTQ